MIASYCNLDKDNWDEMLPFVSYAYNTGLRTSTGFTPYELLYGEPPKHPLDNLFFPSEAELESSPESVQKIVKHLEHVRKAAKKTQGIQKQRMKTRFDKHTCTVAFSVGELVLRRVNRMSTGIEKKALTPFWDGPHRVVYAPSGAPNVVLRLFDDPEGRYDRVPTHHLKLYTKRSVLPVDSIVCSLQKPSTSGGAGVSSGKVDKNGKPLKPKPPKPSESNPSSAAATSSGAATGGSAATDGAAATGSSSAASESTVAPGRPGNQQSIIPRVISTPGLQISSSVVATGPTAASISGAAANTPPGSADSASTSAQNPQATHTGVDLSWLPRADLGDPSIVPHHQALSRLFRDANDARASLYVDMVQQVRDGLLDPTVAQDRYHLFEQEMQRRAIQAHGFNVVRVGTPNWNIPLRAVVHQDPAALLRQFHVTDRGQQVASALSFQANVHNANLALNAVTQPVPVAVDRDQDMTDKEQDGAANGQQDTANLSRDQEMAADKQHEPEGEKRKLEDNSQKTKGRQGGGKMSKVKCHNCGKFGHFRIDCFQLQKFTPRTPYCKPPPKYQRRDRDHDRDGSDKALARKIVLQSLASAF